MDSIKSIDNQDCADELKTIWMSLDKFANENNIRIFGVSQLNRLRIDGSEGELPKQCLYYSDKDFLTKRGSS